jgi:hypothetical protein
MEADEKCPDPDHCAVHKEPYQYYILTGMHPETWYKLAAELDHLGLGYRLFGFSNKEPHVFLPESLAKKLRDDYKLTLDGPYPRVD